MTKVLRYFNGTIEIDGQPTKVYIAAYSLAAAVRGLKQLDPMITVNRVKHFFNNGPGSDEAEAAQRRWRGTPVMFHKSNGKWGPEWVKDWTNPKHSIVCPEVRWVCDEFFDFLGLPVTVSPEYPGINTNRYVLTVSSPTGILLGSTDIWFEGNEPFSNRDTYFSVGGSGYGCFNVGPEKITKFRNSFREKILKKWGRFQQQQTKGGLECAK